MYVKFCVLIIGLCSWRFTEANDRVSCDQIHANLASKGFEKDARSAFGNVGTKSICPKSDRESCCSTSMEQRLEKKNNADLSHLLEQNIAIALSRVSNKAIKFDQFFKDLLVKAKRDFHKLFLDTYGIMYRQNSHVALKLFDDLVDYYSQGKPDLIMLLDGFFLRLYETMFKVLHRQYKFNNRQLSCMRGMMDKVQPFGNVPRRLNAEIKRALVASRIFVQALAVGGNVMQEMMKIGFMNDCSQALMKMTHCSQCDGYANLKPCNSYCLNVMKGCLAYHSDLSTQWEEYSTKLLKLSVRLENAFNIEDVVNPINLEISHAIMNFQENVDKISKAVLEACGRGNLMKRSISGEIMHETYKFPGGRNDFSNPGGNSRKASGIGLKNHVAEIRKDFKVLKSFWRNLPSQICNNADVAADASNENNCWNGAHKARYEHSIVGDGLMNQSRNPELTVNVQRQSSKVNELIILLRITTDRLAKAHDGVYVNYTGSELSKIENLNLGDLVSSAETDQFEQSLIEGSGSGGGDVDCEKDDSCDDDPISTFTLNNRGSSTVKPPPLTTTRIQVTARPTTNIAKETSSSTATEAPSRTTTTAHYNECLGSGCASGSGDFEDDEESVKVTQNPVKVYQSWSTVNPKTRKPLPHNPDPNAINNDLNAHQMNPFSPDHGNRDKDLYFPTTFPGADGGNNYPDDFINEIDSNVNSHDAIRRPEDSSSIVNSVSTRLLVALLFLSTMASSIFHIYI